MNFKDLPRNDQIRWLSNQGGGGPPLILSDGNTVKWFDYLVNVIKDGSNLVSSWDNIDSIPGLIAGALLQADTSRQPTLNANGVLFDGINDFMKSSAFTLIQPTSIYIVARFVTHTNADRLLDGNITAGGAIYQDFTSNDLGIMAGSDVEPNGNLPINTFGVIRVIFNGVNSSLQINETTPLTGDAGSNNMGGFVLGARGSGTALFGNVEVKEVMLRKIVDSSGDSGDIHDYLKDKYSL